MYAKRLLVAALMILLVSSAAAVELDGKTVVSARFPVFVPLFNGDDFMYINGNHQPFMMGWDFGIGVRRGVSDRIMLGATANYLTTYDDTTSLDNSGEDLNNSDDALVKLTGFAFGVEAQWYYVPEWRLQPYFIGGLGVDIWSIEPVDDGDSYSATDFNFKVGTGLLFPINEKFSIDAQVKLTTEVANLSEDIPAGFYGPATWEDLTDRPFRGYLEPSVGLNYFFGGEPDTDGDGVADSKDQCPDTPKDVDVDDNGCPVDTDGDGVADYLDKCPGTERPIKVDAQGCPLDSDGDGVPDHLDKCPNTPAGVTVDAEGCAPDADGDGVPDAADKCPDTPKGTAVDPSGCPLDADNDGVLDSRDQCLGTPQGVRVDSVGCPLVKRITEVISLNIKYASNSFEPDDASKAQLDSIAERIIAYPETKIEIRGYTDSQGSESANQTLSENRANGVRDYLASKGVPADRMTARGFGEDPAHFVADNSTAEGRARNRRVEIESVK